MSCCRRNPAYAGITYDVGTQPEYVAQMAEINARQEAQRKQEKMLKGAAAVAGIGALAYMFSKGKK